MRDCIDIGAAPPMESCAQVGREGYHAQARRECRAFIGLLRRALGDEPTGARLSIKSNAHDFGEYLSIVCLFDFGDGEAIDYAYRCESDGPLYWDEQAKQELSLEDRKEMSE